MRGKNLAARAVGSAAEASPGSHIGPFGRLGGTVGTRALDPPADATGFEAEFERVADQLELRLERLASAGIGAMRASVPAWLSPSDPSWVQLEEHLLSSLRTALASFRAGLLPGGLPPADAALVDAAGKLGDLDGLLAGFRFAHTSLWGTWFDLVDDAPAAKDVKPELLTRGSRFFLRYSELVSRYVVNAYRRRIEPRAGRLGSAAGGDPFADAHLDFDLSRCHLGVIAWGESPEWTARKLATCLDRIARVRPQGETWWVCLSGEEMSQQQLRELHAFAPEPGVRLAIGLEGFGEEGLRLSFRQALRARALAGREAVVTHYADVAVEGLSLHVEEDAHAFVSHELRGIDDDSAASKRLRETLVAYFESNLNAASAAAMLGVHQQTIANRLRTIEERLGRPLVARTLELSLALRLWRRIS